MRKTKYTILDPFPLAGVISRGGKTRTCGIYSIRLICDRDRQYVGSSRNISKRLNNHRETLRRGRHRNPNLQAAYRSFGELQFEVAILEICEESVLIHTEDRWLARLFPKGKLFNLNATASYSGNTFSLETRKRISDSLKRRWSSADNRNAIAEKIKGKTNGARPFKLRAPDGTIHVGVNRAALCRKFGLSTGYMADMVNGKHASCCGWSVAK